MCRVIAGEVSPIVPASCTARRSSRSSEIFDLRRAQEWTAALTVVRRPAGPVPFRGRCMVYRSELMVLHGQWDAARTRCGAPESVCRPPPEPSVGEAATSRPSCIGFAARSPRPSAATARPASWGRPPEPGLALLRLAQGAPAAASARSVGRWTRPPTTGRGRASSARRRDPHRRGRPRRGQGRGRRLGQLAVGARLAAPRRPRRPRRRRRPARGGRPRGGARACSAGRGRRGASSTPRTRRRGSGS